MARNKYPEITEEKILDVSMQLFLERGFENTTIQDIVDHLGNLTKGAVYHHFKSKDEIMDAVIEHLFHQKNPFEEVIARKDLNAREKFRELIRLNQADGMRMKLNIQALPLLKNPRILAGTIESNYQILTPYFYRIFQEGIEDASFHTEYAKELSEILPLLDNLWLAPSIYPATSDEMLKKFRFLAEMLDKMGVPVIDEEIMQLAEDYFKDIENYNQNRDA